MLPLTSGLVGVRAGVVAVAVPWGVLDMLLRRVQRHRERPGARPGLRLGRVGSAPRYPITGMSPRRHAMPHDCAGAAPRQITCHPVKIQPGQPRIVHQ